MPFITIVNWLFNYIWCFLIIGFSDWKIGVFQQTVVRVFLCSFMFSSFSWKHFSLIRCGKNVSLSFTCLCFSHYSKRIKFQSLIPADHRGFKKVSRYFSILSPESSMFAFIDIELISKLSFDSTNIQGLNTYLTFQKVQ